MVNKEKTFNSNDRPEGGIETPETLSGHPIHLYKKKHIMAKE